MTGRDFEHPKEGAQLDFQLVLRAFWRSLAFRFSRHTRPMEVKLASNGRNILCLVVNRGCVTPTIQCYHSEEGFATTSSVVSFREQALKAFREKVNTWPLQTGS